MERPDPVEGARQQREVRLGESLSSFEEAHDDEEIGKERTPEFRHRDRIRHGGDGGQGKDADRKSGGPRYPLGPQAVVAKVDKTGVHRRLRRCKFLRSTYDSTVRRGPETPWHG